MLHRIAWYCNLRIVMASYIGICITYLRVQNFHCDWHGCLSLSHNALEFKGQNWKEQSQFQKNTRNHHLSQLINSIYCWFVYNALLISLIVHYVTRTNSKPLINLYLIHGYAIFFCLFSGLSFTNQLVPIYCSIQYGTSGILSPMTRWVHSWVQFSLFL